MYQRDRIDYTKSTYLVNALQSHVVESFSRVSSDVVRVQAEKECGGRVGRRWQGGTSEKYQLCSAHYIKACVSLAVTYCSCGKATRKMR